MVHFGLKEGQDLETNLKFIGEHKPTADTLDLDKFCQQNFKQNKRFLEQAFCQQNKAFSSKI